MLIIAEVRGIIVIHFLLFLFHMKMCCVFSLEWPHLGNSNAYKQYTVAILQKKITLNYPTSAAMEFLPRDSKTSSKQPR